MITFTIIIIIYFIGIFISNIRDHAAPQKHNISFFTGHGEPKKQPCTAISLQPKAEGLSHQKCPPLKSVGPDRESLRKEVEKLREQCRANEEERRNWLQERESLRKEVEQLGDQCRASNKQREYLEEELQNLKTQMSDEERQRSEIIKLNVGGKHYDTTQSTLTKYPSMLSAMFNERWGLKSMQSEDGRFFY